MRNSQTNYNALKIFKTTSLRLCYKGKKSFFEETFVFNGTIKMVVKFRRLNGSLHYNSWCIFDISKGTDQYIAALSRDDKKYYMVDHLVPSKFTMSSPLAFAIMLQARFDGYGMQWSKIASRLEEIVKLKDN